MDLLDNKIHRNNKGERIIRLKNIKYNLTPKETQALKELRANRDVVIKPADKGGAIVVLDWQAYQAKGFRQLFNTKYYREIETPMSTETCVMINKIITQLYNKGFFQPNNMTTYGQNHHPSHAPFTCYPRSISPVINGRLPPNRRGDPLSVTVAQRPVTSVNLSIISYSP